jgi:hypothetical protein
MVALYYSSVSGRPLDFVVNVDVNGNKGGDATTTSYAVGFNTINLLFPLSSGELLAATSKTCSPIEFDYNNTIFAEPKFLNRKPFSAGVVNQFSFIDILGDYGFIDFDGIRSFNAVNALQNEGRNSIFSKMINSRLVVKQSSNNCCAAVFDNYSFFSLETIYGFNVAVYDNTNEQWISFDDFGLELPIKQFAIADQSSNPTLYGITESGVYRLYSSSSYLSASVELRGITSGKARTECRMTKLRGVFSGGTTAGRAVATEVLNGVVSKVVTERMTEDQIDNIVFQFQKAGSGQGWKVKPKLSWNEGSTLVMVEFEGNEITAETGVRRRAQNYAST